MESSNVQKHIQNWLNENHSPGAQRDVLLKVLTVGKSSHSWLATIQRYIKERTMHSPSKGEIKMACRAILENPTQ